ncbi:LPXTG-motif cell wall-anchored protein [Kibdelosporangium banguiense]|uniref:LPXTG-motif cell wall-anchored protein n=1 Tax=Kibdelosporangium banguiense TaxID=1365924 RepID=A0ABS4TXR5_9PSEU|nr:LPXTG cell wall anchor domain-containing protein [Kibdelosporangium banguiense]MBP2329164.1 LPXTG-motif cell wall-anchored protein [Kibdelosporangium banguiense]
MERTFRRALTVLALSVGVSFGGAALASAAPQDPPQSGDARAAAVEGNVTTCEAAGLPGTEIKVTSDIAENTYIDITAAPADYTITGVVVKGGPAYNKYPNLGALPWNDLHAPLVPSGKPAEISHWFVCGEKKTTTTTSTTTSTSTSTSTTASPSTSSGSSTVVTTTSAAAGQTSSDSGLANTGFNGALYLFAGGALLLAGAGTLVLSRRRRRS